MTDNYELPDNIIVSWDDEPQGINVPKVKNVWAPKYTFRPDSLAPLCLVNVKVNSTVEGREWQFASSSAFALEISAKSENAVLPSPSIARTNENGIAVWSNVTLPEGTYEYTVKELNDFSSITCEQPEHTYSITIAADTYPLTSTDQGSWDDAPTVDDYTCTIENTWTPVEGIPYFQDEFGALSWMELAKLSEKCAVCETTGDYHHLLGLTKEIDIANMGTVKCKLIGLNHDTFINGETAGFTFQLTDGLSYNLDDTYFKMNSTDTIEGGWASSEMRNTYLPILYETLPKELTSLIKYVVKSTSTETSGTEVSDTPENLFLLSLIESIGDKDNNYTDNPVADHNFDSPYLIHEGSQYEYYKRNDIGMSARHSHCIPDDSDECNDWWLRSVFNESFGKMTNSGGFVFEGGSNDPCLPAAAFCISSTPTLAAYSPSVQKVVETDSSFDLSKKLFEFDIKAITDGAPMPFRTFATTGNTGKATFEKILFEDYGTYEYEITEKNTNLRGVTYDETPHKLIIDIKENSGPEPVNQLAQQLYDFLSIMLLSTDEQTKELTSIITSAQEKAASASSPMISLTLQLIASGVDQMIIPTISEKINPYTDLSPFVMNYSADLGLNELPTSLYKSHGDESNWPLFMTAEACDKLIKANVVKDIVDNFQQFYGLFDGLAVIGDDSNYNFTHLKTKFPELFQYVEGGSNS